MIIGALATFLFSSPVRAQEEEETIGITQIRVSDLTRSMYDAPITLTPQVGVFGFGDAQQSYTSRLMEGFNLGVNLRPLLGQMGGFMTGFETGLLYSHLGAPTSNFIGTNPSTPGGSGANAYLIPGTITLGYRLSDRSTVGLKLGTQLLHQSVANSINTGRTSTGGSSWDFFPSIGANAGYALGQRVGLSLRGDYIPTPAQDLFNATLGATIALG